jgi:hypothetical protein
LFAFWLHLPESHFPACAVASSQDWKATFRSPAFHLRWSRTKRIASTIWVCWNRDAPWSGKSLAMRTSGFPSPLYSSFEHDDEGSALTEPDGAPPDVVLAAVVPSDSLSPPPPQPPATIAQAPTSSAARPLRLRFLKIPFLPPSPNGRRV